MKTQSIVITIIILIVIITGLIILLKDKFEPALDITKTITPTQANQICNSKSCISEEVEIEGKMSRLGAITDDTDGVIVIFSKEISLKEETEIKEKNQLINEGTIIQAKIKGKLNYVDSSESELCFNEGCIEYVEIITKPEDIQFIKTSGCKEGYDNCFDNSRYELKASEAYEALQASEVGTKDGREATGYYDYDFEGNFWRFQISDPNSPGGCSDYCHVYKNKIIFKRSCAGGSPDEIVEEIY